MKLPRPFVALSRLDPWCAGHGLTELYTLLLGRRGCCSQAARSRLSILGPEIAYKRADLLEILWRVTILPLSLSLSLSLSLCDLVPTPPSFSLSFTHLSPSRFTRNTEGPLFYPVTHVRVAGLINLIGVVARLAKEKEETVVAGCARYEARPRNTSGALKGREADPFPTLAYFLIDRTIILSFGQINEHSREHRVVERFAHAR